MPPRRNEVEGVSFFAVAIDMWMLDYTDDKKVLRNINRGKSGKMRLTQHNSHRYEKTDKTEPAKNMQRKKPNFAKWNVRQFARIKSRAATQASPTSRNEITIPGALLGTVEPL